MKIGIDIRPLMDMRYSGVSEYTKDLLAALLAVNERAGKHEIILYYNSGRDIRAKMAPFATNGSRLVHTVYPNKLYNYVLEKTLRYPKIDRLAGEADLFFMPHINFAALSAGTKLILTVHDLSFLRYPEFFSARKNIWHNLNGYKRLIARADVVVAISASTKRDLVELLRVPRNKIAVIRSGISRQLLQAPDETALSLTRRKYDLPEKYVLCLGTIEPRKNIAGIVGAFEDYIRDSGDAGTCLVLAGCFGWKTDEIRKAIAASPVNDRIRLLGYVDSEDKAALYGLAGVLLYPSFYEGFGFPVLEALVCGTPVISGNNSSLPEIAGKHVLLTDPYNTAELSRALDLTLNKSAFLNDFKCRQATIRESIKNEFDWDLTAASYYALFK